MTDLGLTTRDRLIEVAGEAFAQVGFREARIRDICARAGANIAAVNYHFGGKEGLYRAVLEQAQCHEGARELLESLAGLEPEAQLRGFIRGFLARMFDEGRPAWLGKLMAREMVEPTEALDRIVERTIRPEWDLLVEVVARLAGPGVDRETIELSAASVMGQCVLYRNCAPIIERLFPDGEPTASIERTAAHIADFSLAALATLRQSSRGGGRPGA